MARLTDRGNVALSLGSLRVVARRRSAFHAITLYRHPQLGRVLALNGEIQHVEAWAPLYHETLVHVPLLFVPRPRSALVLGGGSLFAAAELLKYPTIERVLMVERDLAVVALVKRHYDHAVKCVGDSRLQIIECDGFQFLDGTRDRFDLVVNDATDLLSVPGHGQRSVFRRLAATLTPAGVCSDIVFRHVFDGQSVERTLEHLKPFRSALGLILVPEYPGVLHALTIWGSSRHIDQNARKSVNKQHLAWAREPLSRPFTYFDPRYVRHHLFVPSYLRH